MSMKNKLMMAALAGLFTAAPLAPSFAATDHSGFGDMFTNQAPAGLQDPVFIAASAEPSAASVAGIEPAAGDASPTATQNVEAVAIPDYDAVDSSSTTGHGN
jgi:hypothetical protein